MTPLKKMHTYFIEKGEYTCSKVVETKMQFGKEKRGSRVSYDIF